MAFDNLDPKKEINRFAKWFAKQKKEKEKIMKKKIFIWVTLLWTTICFVMTWPGMTALVEASINNAEYEPYFPTGVGLLDPNDPLAWRMDGRPGSFEDSFESFSAMSVAAESEIFELEPPCPADEAEDGTVIFNQDIQDLVLNLKRDPWKMYYFILNKVYHSPYRGSRGGSLGTLENMIGNDIDQASLLITMLRYAGYPAKYIKGWVEYTPEELKNWVDANTDYAAANTLYQRYNEIQQTQDGFNVKRVWVAAYIDGKWEYMDPAFKPYKYTPKGPDTSNEAITQNIIDSASQTGDSLSVDHAVVTEQLDAQLNYTVVVGEGLTFKEIWGGRDIEETSSTVPISSLISGEDGKPLLDSLGIKTISQKNLVATEEFSSVAEADKMKIKIIMPGGTVVEKSTSEIAGKRLSFLYNIERKEITSADPSITIVYPMFQIDGETVATGDSILLGKPQTFKAGFLKPWTGQGWKMVESEQFAGGQFVLGHQVQKISFNEKLKEEAIKLREEALLLTGDELMNVQMMDEILFFKNRVYYALHNHYLAKLSQKIEVGYVSEGAIGFFSAPIRPLINSNGDVVEIKQGNVVVDIPFCVVNLVSKNATLSDYKKDEISNWMITGGSIGSSLEHMVIEILFDIDALSTVKIFSEAARTGVDIIVLDNPESVDTSLEKIEFREEIDDSIKALIRSYVIQGRIVVIPKQAITLGSWTGWGWLVAASDYSSLGFQIQGGLNGGYATEPINPTVATVAKTGLKVWETADTTAMTTSIFFAAGTKAYAGYFVAVELSGTSLAAIGTTLLVGQVVVATLLVVAGGVIFVTLIDSIWGDNESLYMNMALRKNEYDSGVYIYTVSCV